MTGTCSPGGYAANFQSAACLPRALHFVRPSFFCMAV
nr:MAG TPA: hypothetical protein [Caudoviricetes sp.]